jgi:hypothetical protein
LDVDEDACSVTELSLVLTLLDYVDPPDLGKPCYNKFKLPALRNQNIFHCKEGFFGPKSEWQKAKPRTGYDWIVGNPPWKKLNSKKLEKGDRAALDWIRNNKTQYPASDNQLAEAFAWEVTQYLSNQGLVGLLIPAATLFKTKAVSFRRQFFDQMDAWCVVNFANLRHLLFQGAVNPAAAFFYSISQESKKEKNLCIRTYAPFVVSQLTRYEANNRGRKKLWTVIVNADEIREIPQNDAASGSSQPWKLAMWGSLRDRHLLVSLAKRFDLLSKFAKKRGLAIHEGLQLRTKDANEPVQAIQEVEGQRELDMSVLRGCRKIFAFPEDALVPIEASRRYVRKGRGTKPLKICYPPHIVIDAARRFAVFSNEFIVVPPRQIGIAGSPGDVNLLKALALYLSSDFAIYHQFLSSTLWGIERDISDKNDLGNLPIPLDGLSDKELARWASLHDELVRATSSDLQKSKSSLFEAPQETPNSMPLLKQLNKAVYALLNIDRTERWLIQDLLHVRMGLNEGRLAEEAITLPDKSEILAYAGALKKELDDFLDSHIKDQHRVTVYYTEQLAIVEIEHPKQPPAGPASVIRVEDPTTEKEFKKLRSNLLREQGQWVYFNRNLKIFKGRTTYFVKPSQRLNWLKSQALLDADEFIAEKLTLTGDG